jgi:VIT1/CCC1 family predicted Fe2+/Mn2+ transporter
MRRKLRQHIGTDYLRSILFGFEDGLVSTTGAVVGISAGVQNANVIVLAGLVIITVEAISMGAGEFVSEETVHDIDRKRPINPALGAAMMFISYFIAGLIPVLPFVLLELEAAVITALILAFIGLFLLGYVTGKVAGVSPLRRGLQILIIGGVATLIGVLVGVLLKNRQS